jgi:hypothetical protein
MGEKNEDEASMTGGSVPIARRDVLKSVGVSGSTLVGFGTTAAAAEDPQIDVTQLSGARRNKVVSAAMSDGRTRRIRAEMRNGEFYPEPDDARCARVEPASAESYRVVVIPFEQAGVNRKGVEDQDEQVLLRWLDDDRAWTELGRVVGHRMETVERQNGQPTGCRATTYHVQSGEVVSRTKDVGAPEPTDGRGISPNKIIGPPPGHECQPAHCLGAESPCGWDWECVTFLAASYGSLYGCTGCNAGAVPMCGACILAIIAAYGTTINCDPTQDCELEYSCDPCYCENPVPPGC